VRHKVLDDWCVLARAVLCEALGLDLVSLNKEHQVRERYAAAQTVLRKGLFDLVYQQEECMLVLYLELERRVL